MSATLRRTFWCILGAFLVVLAGNAGRAGARETRQGDVIDEITRRIDVRDNAAVFALFVLLNAAGYDDGADAPMHTVRRSVRGALPRLVADTMFEKIETYYTRHDASANIASYVIAAFATSGPPNFAQTFAWDDDVANRPTFRAHAELPALLRSFARTIRLDSIYRAQQAAHLAYSVEYTPVIRREAAAALRYMRVASRADLYRFGERPRTIIIPNLLMARGSSFSFALDSTFYVVEGPQAMTAVDAHEVIRAATYRLTHDAAHNALHRKATPVMTGIRELRPMLQRMAAADFIEENIVSAVALRYREDRRDSEAARATAMERVRAGFVLVPYFLEQLARYETQNASLRTYYPRLFDQLDGARELARWRDSIR